MQYGEWEIMNGNTDLSGEPGNKKFMIERFREQIPAVNKLPMPEQKKKPDDTITTWIGRNEQTDDILVVAIRFSQCAVPETTLFGAPVITTLQKILGIISCTAYCLLDLTDQRHGAHHINVFTAGRFERE